MTRPAPTVTVPVDDLAQEIRRVDGNHDLGAGALAEALVPFLSSMLSAAPAALRIAEEALEAAKTIEPLCMELADCMDEERDALVSELQQAHGKIADALAALQADKKGGA